MVRNNSIHIYCSLFSSIRLRMEEKCKAKRKNMVEDARIWRFGGHSLTGNPFNMAG